MQIMMIDNRRYRIRREETLEFLVRRRVSWALKLRKIRKPTGRGPKLGKFGGSWENSGREKKSGPAPWRPAFYGVSPTFHT